jgi:hypothetical protein
MTSNMERQPENEDPLREGAAPEKTPAMQEPKTGVESPDAFFDRLIKREDIRNILQRLSE